MNMQVGIILLIIARLGISLGFLPELDFGLSNEEENSINLMEHVEDEHVEDEHVDDEHVDDEEPIPDCRQKKWEYEMKMILRLKRMVDFKKEMQTECK